MAENRTNYGCLFGAGLLIFSAIGLIIGAFDTNKKTTGKAAESTKVYLTIGNNMVRDTLLSLVSPFSISENNKIKETVENTLPFKDSLVIYSVDIPRGLSNLILLSYKPSDKDFNLNGAATGSIDRIKNNSDVENLTYKIRDTIIQNTPAKKTIAKFSAHGKNARLEQIDLLYNNCLYSLQFINEENNTEWNRIDQLTNSVVLLKTNSR